MRLLNELINDRNEKVERNWIRLVCAIVIAFVFGVEFGWVWGIASFALLTFVQTLGDN